MAVAEYFPLSSPLKDFHPLTKMAWALGVFFLSLLFTNFFYLALLVVLVLMVALLGRVWPVLKGSLKGLLIFAFILFLMQVLFYREGIILFYLLPLGQGYVGITDKGIFFGLAMAFRMLAIVLSFLIFLTTTRTQDIIATLVENIRIPADVAFMIMAAIRFIPTFLGELAQISDAQRARALVLEGRNPFKKISAYLPLTVPLVLLSLEKAQGMALAMETRGYGAGPRSRLRDLIFSRQDRVAFILLAGLLLGGILLRWQGFGI